MNCIRQGRELLPLFGGESKMERSQSKCPIGGEGDVVGFAFVVNILSSVFCR